MTVFTPEIVKGDPLYTAIFRSMFRYKPRIVVEIGSANGKGSTQAFIEGLSLVGEGFPDLYCIELDAERATELRQVAYDLKQRNSHVNMICCEGTTIPAEEYVKPEDFDSWLKGLRAEYPNLTTWQYSTELIRSWYDRDLELVKKAPVVNVPWHQADFALVDGSPFTGWQECDLLAQARCLALDDVNDIKNIEAYNHLKSSKRYFLVEEDLGYRNGYAIFERRF